jgi:hypothetical protein
VLAGTGAEEHEKQEEEEEDGEEGKGLSGDREEGGRSSRALSRALTSEEGNGNVTDSEPFAREEEERR